MIFERKPRSPLRVELVPMIDISYIIITFLLVFAVFRSSDAALKLNLPRAVTAEHEVQLPVTITVTKAGQFFVAGQAVSADQLKDLVRSRVGQHPDQGIVIRTDRDVRFQYIVDAMDAVRSVGGSRIALAVARTIRPANQ